MVGNTTDPFEFSIQNEKAFKKALTLLSKKSSDFRIPFKLISVDWYKSNRKIFTLKSEGLYQKLAPATGIDGNPTTTSNYEKTKAKKLGFAYPIFRGKTRRLEKSLRTPSAEGAVLFVGRSELNMGSSIEYLKYHQGDGARKKIPRRDLVFIDGGPADRARDASIAGRRERWTRIIFTHVKQLITESNDVTFGGLGLDPRRLGK